jgi:hypothetical protein
MSNTVTAIVSTLIERKLIFSIRSYILDGVYVTEIYSKHNAVLVKALFNKEFEIKLDNRSQQYSIAKVIH